MQPRDAANVNSIIVVVSAKRETGGKEITKQGAWKKKGKYFFLVRKPRMSNNKRSAILYTTQCYALHFNRVATA